MSMDTFDPNILARFLEKEDENITTRWVQYLERRNSGMPREMFKDLDHAKWWLKQVSPVKYVDGALLGHIHRVTTPLSLRPITRKAWQIMSEELGDGDVSKNHVYLWRELMNDIEAGLPDSDSEDFIDSKHGLDRPHIWKSGLAQLLISIFPHEFLPELLGFNMHFKMLTWDTMRAMKELKELKLNDYYFLLHISIDNADSGHTAMALRIVVDYMLHIQKTEGKAAAHQAWRRVQTGFTLSERLPASPDAQLMNNFQRTTLSEHEAKVLQVFKAKSSVSSKLHCGSRVQIKSRTLVEWLDPVAFENSEWQKDFLRSLANSKPWVYKGDSERSNLMHILGWNGKMFGSFTQAEVSIVREWIDSLGNSFDPNLYWNFTGRVMLTSKDALATRDIRQEYPVLSSANKNFDLSPSTMSMSELRAPISVNGRLELEVLIPLWFIHASLLEGFMAVPFKTISPTSSAVIRVLRAQYGFELEGDGVAGTDEFNRLDCVDIIDLGREMTSRMGLSNVTCLKDVLDQSEATDSTDLLHLSMRPVENREVLLGMTWGFVSLHGYIAASEDERILCQGSKNVLKAMAARERAALEVCLSQILDDVTLYGRFCTGVDMARTKIIACFEMDSATEMN